MKNVISQNHFRFKAIPEVIKIAQPLYDDTGYINFHVYLRQYDNGAAIELPTKKDWGNHFYNHYLMDQNNTKNRLSLGINFWKRNSHQNISEIMEDARDNFNIDGRIDFVSRDNINNCYHTYSFTTNRKNADKAYMFYDMHRSKLLKFIIYLRKNLSHLIKEAEKPDNLVYIPDYSTAGIENPLKNYALELEQEYPDTKLEDREFEITLLYAAGYTAEQIAGMLCKSTRTIETYLYRAKQKFNFKNRIEMKKYLKDKGYDGLEEFFLVIFPMKQKPNIDIKILYTKKNLQNID